MGLHGLLHVVSSNTTLNIVLYIWYIYIILVYNIYIGVYIYLYIYIWYKEYTYRVENVLNCTGLTKFILCYLHYKLN